MDMGAVPAPTAGSLLGQWTASPVADLLLALAAVAYLVGVRRLRAGGGHWPVRRTAAGVAAVVLLVVSLNSALAVYAMALFWAHMLVHLLLIMVVPVLVLWARPVQLLHDVAGPRLRARVEAVTGSRAVAVATNPLIAVPVYTATLVLTHLTGFQQVMLGSDLVMDLETLLYLVVGYLTFASVVGSPLLRQHLSHPLKFVVLAVSMGADTLVGVVLMLTPTAIAPGYAAARAGGWGPTALADQGAAGSVMWFAGDGLMMVLMLVVAGQWAAAAPGEQGLGRWLDGIRSQQLMGSDWEAGGDGGIDVDADDDEDRALAAYNARLAALHGRSSTSN
ncbi:cytochrome c oxidase assembly protein [Rhodococcus aerolatus]